MKPLIPVILAGGVGSRLWPLSRALFPKPFHALHGERTLLQNTVLRANKATSRPPIVVCNEDNRFLVAEQMRAVGVEWRYIALEPEGRNTAAAIALAAHLAVRDDDDAQLLVLPADHRIDDDARFVHAVEAAAAASGDGAVVAFGIAPTRPETGYGYIERVHGQGLGVQPIRRFVEKPDPARAQAFSASGRHLWNSGMFVAGARIALAEIEAHRRELAHAVCAVCPGRSVRPGFLSAGQGVSGEPDRFVRCGGYGKDRACGGIARGLRLERHRNLGVGSGGFGRGPRRK